MVNMTTALSVVPHRARAVCDLAGLCSPERRIDRLDADRDNQCDMHEPELTETVPPCRRAGILSLYTYPRYCLDI